MARRPSVLKADTLAPELLPIATCGPRDRRRSSEDIRGRSRPTRHHDWRARRGRPAESPRAGGSARRPGDGGAPATTTCCNWPASSPTPPAPGAARGCSRGGHRSVTIRNRALNRESSQRDPRGVWSGRRGWSASLRREGLLQDVQDGLRAVDAVAAAFSHAGDDAGCLQALDAALRGREGHPEA